MSILSLVMIAVGLSMDAFAVSVTNGITIKGLQFRHAFKIAFFFGFFQAFMPVLGWTAGVRFSEYIIAFDHWVAFIVLAMIGGKMIYESLKEADGQSEAAVVREDPVNNRTLTMLAVATSIDALAVGVSFSFLNIAIFTAALIIGCITFCLSFAGVMFGEKCGQFLQKKAEVLGGVILILIGTKILLEHTGILGVLL
ncbi:MAG: manganese efflux pump MntP family protein [bacterium]|jgi:putative Mn2+ efflux pump MntP